MRKIDPDGVRDDFIAAITWVEALGGLVEDAPGAPQQLSELQLLAAVVYWEGFLTDLFVAYLNRDSARFTNDLRQRISQSVEGKFGRTAAANVSFKVGPHLNRDTVINLLDPQGRNLSFSSADDLLAKARQLLPRATAQRFEATLRRGDRALIDAWTAIRNFVAHRSRAAKSEMNRALADQRLRGCFRRGVNQINSVGRYLCARSAPGYRPRLEIILRKMRRFARRL
jgi:hypothetical protein